MKIAITAVEPSLSSRLYERFGRCVHFVLVNPDTAEYSVLSNPGVDANGGAGTGAAQLLADSGVNVVISGNVGPKALRALQTAGIKVYIARNCTVQQALDDFKAGRLQEANKSTIATF